MSFMSPSASVPPAFALGVYLVLIPYISAIISGRTTMRKPPAAIVLAMLLAGSWVGFFATAPRAEERPPADKWSYRQSDEGALTNLGQDGWEAYAVLSNSASGGSPTYFLRKRTN